MEKEVIKKVMKECSISKRKAEELVKIDLFYGYTIDEAIKHIKEFYKSST